MRQAAKDPIFFEGGQANLFSYAANDPLNLIDRTGLAGSQGILKKTSNPFTNFFGRNNPAIAGDVSIAATKIAVGTVVAVVGVGEAAIAVGATIETGGFTAALLPELLYDAGVKVYGGVKLVINGVEDLNNLNSGICPVKRRK